MTNSPPEFKLPDDYHAAVGVITVNAAILDNLINNAIWVVLKMPPDQGRLITDPILSTRRKIDLLNDLVVPMISDDALKNEFSNMIGKLRSSQKDRSKIVHAKWVVKHSDRSIHIEVPSSDETQPGVEPMPLDRLRGYGDALALANILLEQFFLKVEMSPAKSGSYVWPPRFSPRRGKPSSE